MNSSVSKDTSGIKYLRSIPLLGMLFRNKKTIDKKTELVIFVTPKVINANSRTNKEGVAQHKILIKKFREAVELEDWMDDESRNADLLTDTKAVESSVDKAEENVDPVVTSDNPDVIE